LLLVERSGHHRVLHSFPTRRSSDLGRLRRQAPEGSGRRECEAEEAAGRPDAGSGGTEGASVKKMVGPAAKREAVAHLQAVMGLSDRKSTRLNSSHVKISYAVFCLKK